MNTTAVFEKNIVAFNSGVRRIVNKGGTSSSKTISTIQLLLIIAQKRAKEGVTITVTSESLPHLKLGAMRDFENILKQEGLYNTQFINQTNHSFHFGKSVIEFYSADNSKATGPRRNILYANECNNIPYSTLREMEQRTSECIFYDYNPVRPFWIDEEIFTLPQNEYTLIKSNYLDNQFLPEPIKREIELRSQRDSNYKRIHVLCEYGIYEGLVFPEITLIDEDKIPKDIKPVFGIDFGFTNDPTAVTKIIIDKNNLYVKEILYKTGMFSPDIIAALKQNNINREEITADSSDPRMIEEIKRAGFNIFPAIKGAGSIVHGLDVIKRHNIFVSKGSINLIKEFRNYQYKIDSSGNTTNDPIDYFNHAIDSLRYGIQRKIASPGIGKGARFTFVQ